MDGDDGIWRAVVGQPSAIALLSAAAKDPVHAYLFVGPPGCTKFEAARAFAGLVVDPSGDADGRDARLARAGEHPDVREIHRVGAAIDKAQAEEVVRLAALSPVEGRRKVLILDEFHLLRPEGAARLLKTVEEPPPSTVFVIVADDVPHDLVTIASPLRAGGLPAAAARRSSPRSSSARAPPPRRPWPRPAPPQATWTGLGCSPTTRRSRPGRRPSSGCRTASTAAATPCVWPSMN